LDNSPEFRIFAPTNSFINSLNRMLMKKKIAKKREKSFIILKLLITFAP